ncbi:MAG: heavy-metal-associated domain-containing protein, partial [Candidatus Doudnabacteria bacterium]|nr:heavy-metal-associated domain-containing protein [Candidatus Doudnabacteria bacterium]
MSDSKQKVVSVTTQEYFVEGMHCAACEVLVSERMLEVPGVQAAEAKLVTKTVQITWDGQLDVEGLRLKGTELLRDVGYKLHLGDTAPGHAVAWRKLLLPLILALVIFGGFLLLQESPLTGLLSGTQATTLSFAFLLGLVASVSTCMAVVGG